MRKKYGFTAALLVSALLCGCSDISGGVEDTFVHTEATTPTEEPDVIAVIATEEEPKPEIKPARTYTDEEIAAFHDRIEEIREECWVYGMSVAVFDNGNVIYADGFGLADKENEIPCTADTIFRAASVSKTISTVLLMQLCDKGMISPESDLEELTGLPFNSEYAGGRVKLWHLLTHTAGITDTNTFELGISQRYKTETVLKTALIGTKPGEVYNYTNFGAGLVGTLIELLTGEYFQDYADSNMFKPLGMDAGYAGDFIEHKDNCAKIYDYDGEIYNPATWGRTAHYYESFGLGNSYLQAQSELLITAPDLARLGTALAGDGTVPECGNVSIISPASLDEMHKKRISTDKFDMGLNVRIYDGTLVPGRVMYGHTGNALGAITGIFYDRTDHTGIAILSNRCNYYVDDTTGVYKMLYLSVNEAYKTFFGAEAGAGD
ncbi:MAG: beta-lactamase family protein [Ruminiclostridium sp.]|nr:beta-lactamase family protein [Ruminiclostridium sp.]